MNFILTIYSDQSFSDPTIMTSPFPRDIAEFDDDERIAFDKVDNKYILEDENGVQWEFNEKVGRWTQTVSVLFLNSLPIHLSQRSTFVELNCAFQLVSPTFKL